MAKTHVYDPIIIEKKWQRYWDEHKVNEIDLAAAENPYYVLMMFPYPSAEGLHVGNVYAFTGADVYGRHRRLRGYDVFEPIGFDAFGIHSENFAMKVNRHPSELIPSNVANFTRQLRMMGFMFDWRRTVDTTQPDYYKWTQWVFLQLYKAGLAYRDTKEVNYCPDCGTVISDEQVNTDGTCERHPGTTVQRRMMPCWFFRITEFAEELHQHHSWLDWSDRTKTAQLQWIGRSDGAEVDFQVEGHSEKIRVFTTRPDTLFGATYMVMAPDHPLVDAIAAEEQRAAVAAYRQQCSAGDQCSTGVPPVNGQATTAAAPSATTDPTEHSIVARYNPDEVLRRYGARLPHWLQEDAVYHVVFRLADSLPAHVIDHWGRQRDELRFANRPLSPEEEGRLEELLHKDIEVLLNSCQGECILREPAVAELVQNALLHFDGERYDLVAWCIMPNHVHAVVHPHDGHELSSILHSWKSFTSKEIKKVVGGEKAHVWQEEYFDHLIRSEKSLRKAVEYVLMNPETANIVGWEWRGTGSTASGAIHGQDARATLAAPPSAIHGQDARATLAAPPARTPEKTGVYTGARAINPVTGELIPVYISDYVLMGYGTGAIMAVPCGDHRDFAFARKFDLPIPCILDPDVANGKAEDLSGLDNGAELLATAEGREQVRAAVLAGEACWSGAGKAINSANDDLSLNGLPVDEAKKAMTAWLESRGLGAGKVTYRLRDWGISRQRYWGPPIPIIYDHEGNAHPVPEDQLPVELPPMTDFRPKGDGRGPLATNEEWINTTLPDGRPGRRETDVMDNFLDSAWYFLRYISSNDPNCAYDPELIRKWLPVDMYIGGNEHAVLHLMYTRFICLALARAGVLDMKDTPETRGTAEPFRHFRAHGLIVRDGAKMSKSKGNVVNPDAYVEDLGADTVRMYLMFLGPYLQGGDFRDKDIEGVSRFLKRLYAWYCEGAQPVVPDEELPNDLRVKTHQTIKKVTEDIDNLSYNTAIAAMMEFFNAVRAAEATSTFIKESLVLCLAPFAPHFVEEIWQGVLGKERSIWREGRYPQYDPALTQFDSVEIVLQHQGKIRDRIVVPREATAEELEKLALANEKIQAALAGRTPKKIISVPGRLVNVIG